jgi:HEAT repeat protein
LPAFDVLTDEEIFAIALEHEETPARLEALDLLEDLDLSSSQVPPLLSLAQGGAPLEIRAAAWRTLNRVRQVAEVRAAAQAAFADASLPAQLRVAALITLLPDFPLENWKPQLEAFLNDPPSRADAVQAMWRSREPVFRSSFGAFLDDPDLQVRRQAIRGAGIMGDKTSLAKLRAAFGDDDLRKDALFSYAMAVPVESVSASRMRSLLKRIDEEAGGLLPNEATDVQLALDMRLEAAGKAPIFFPHDEDDDHVHGPGCGHVH